MSNFSSGATTCASNVVKEKEYTAAEESFDNVIEWNEQGLVESKREIDETFRGGYKYDSIAKWNYPAPYTNQHHGSGV